MSLSGFAGAGAQDRLRIKGLTTAASLCVTAAIGVAAGLGAYEAAGITAGFALLVLLPLKWVEDEIFPRAALLWLHYPRRARPQSRRCGATSR